MVLNEDLMGRFDLIVSLNVFEHLPDPTIAVTHLRSYLTARGRLVSLLSGRYSCFGVANRLLPARVGSALAAYVTDRQRDTVFPAYYRECYYDGLVRLFSAWRRTEIYPQFRGEIYFRSLRSARATYLAYEGLMYHTMRRNLATHYFVVADR
jgi:SAM-dependent methyltransferase